MRKSDLKSGQIVETREGERFLYLGEKFICKDGCFLDQYSEDLFDEELAEFDIMKVYNSKATNLDEIFEDKYLSCVWTRSDNIDWNKVPRGTKVQVRNLSEEDWVNAYFLEHLSTANSFIASSNLFDEYTSSFGRQFNREQCRIHPDEILREEWIVK